MKQLFITSLFFVLLFVSNRDGIAQEMYVRDLYDFYREMGITKHQNLEKTYNDIQGSPYLQDGFIEGTVTRKNGDVYHQVPLRYNGYDDQIEFKPPTGVALYLSNPEEFQSVTIGSQKYIYLSSNSKRQEADGYFELLEDGKTKLLKKHAVVLKEAEPAKPYQDPKPAAFEKEPASFFVLNEKQEVIEISNTNSLLDALPSANNELKSYLKKNKLKVRKEDDLRQVIAHYNEL